MIFAGSALQAQSRIAYADAQKILQSLKETQVVQQKLQGEQEKLYRHLQYLQDSLNTMQDDYVKNYKDNPLFKQNVKQSFLKGIEELSYVIQNNQQKYQDDLYKKQQELMEPILDKVRNALEKIRKADGLDFILDSASGILLSYETKYDVTQRAIDELVKMSTETDSKPKDSKTK